MLFVRIIVGMTPIKELCVTLLKKRSKLLVNAESVAESIDQTSYYSISKSDAPAAGPPEGRNNVIDLHSNHSESMRKAVVKLNLINSHS